MIPYGADRIDPHSGSGDPATRALRHRRDDTCRSWVNANPARTFLAYGPRYTCTRPDGHDGDHHTTDRTRTWKSGDHQATREDTT